MSTPAEILVSLSDIASGTPAEHLLAITTGGTGPGETVYVDRIAAEISGDLDTEFGATITADVGGDIHAAAGDNIEAEISDNIEGDVD